MAKIYFYDIAKLYDDGFINGNADEKLIKPTLLVVQDIYILPLIGSGIFDELKSQIDASTVGTNDAVTSANQTLLNDYLQPVILWWVMYEFTLAGHYKYMNKGVMERNSENAQPVSIENLERIAKPHKDKAEHYTARVSRFLCQNSSTYPLYTNAGNGVDTVFPDSTTFQSGMSLDDYGSGNSSMRFNGGNGFYNVTNIGKPISE